MQGERPVQIAEKIAGCVLCKCFDQFDLLFLMLFDHLGNNSFPTRHSSEWGSGQCGLGERRRREEVVDNSSLSAVVQQDVKIHQVRPLELYCNGYPIMGYCPARCDYQQTNMLLIMGTRM